MKKPTLLSWSSGKDSAWALRVLQDSPDLEVVGLFSTINEKYDRVYMHGLRRDLLEQQAESLELPLELIPLPDSPNNSVYESIMNDLFSRVKEAGIECIAFGDLFLEDARAWREASMADSGLTPVFPLWGKNTRELAAEMIHYGLKAKLICIDLEQCSADFIGKDIDQRFLGELPDDVDPCGENGEFHTFVYDGPMFEHVIPVRAGEIVNHSRFVYLDLMAAGY